MVCVCKVMKTEKESFLFFFFFSTLRTLIFNAVSRFCFFFLFSPRGTFKTNIVHTANIFCAKKQCLLCPPNPKSQFSSQVIVTTNYNSHFGLINNVNNNNQYWFERTPKQGKVNFLGYYPILQHWPCPCNFLCCNVLIIFFSITWGIHFFSVHFLWIKLMLILWLYSTTKIPVLRHFDFFVRHLYGLIIVLHALCFVVGLTDYIMGLLLLLENRIMHEQVASSILHVLTSFCVCFLGLCPFPLACIAYPFFKHGHLTL